MLFKGAAQKAQKLHQKAQKLSDKGRDEAAIATYLKAIALDPQKSESHYNIGLITKYRNQWETSFHHNQQAYRIAPHDEAARWNYAIAATALEKWSIARSLWRDNGLDIDEGEDEIEMNFGITPIRLNPDDNAEVVWATRIDPVRAKIDSIPFPESGFLHGDIILHDGAPLGSRTSDGKEYPVFNVLQRQKPSNFITHIADVTLQNDQQLDDLAKLLNTHHYAMEDWTLNTRNLCRQCSEGTPHEQHDDDLHADWHNERTLGIACPAENTLTAFLEQWQKATGATLTRIN